MITRVAIISGGIFSEHKSGEPLRSHQIVHRLITQYGATTEVDEDEDYCVDIAFLTGAHLGEDIPIGISAGPVNRTKFRRFIVWHRLPLDLHAPESVRDWFVDVLPETERLVREHLPTKSRKFPAGQLADEVAGLRDFLRNAEV